VFYKLLPPKAIASILNQKNFSGAPVTIKGTVTRFSNTKNSFYLVASSIEWE
jgi:hypothetical protein